ncbi:MAG: flagellar hook basal-body protein [bacterium]|nr:flagellar hook basal-body protein [Candidatus Margulisiibacteriota bacterium]
MTDRIMEIGEAGLESADQKVRKLMDNMAGAEIPGYRKSDAIIRAFPLELEAANQRISAMKPQVEGSYFNDSQGALIKTGGKLDIALGGEGFFVVVGPWGEGYTRDGRFRIDQEGRLLSVAGNFPVLGEHGPIILPQGADVEFEQTGEIKVDDVVIDKIYVVNPERQEDFESLNGSLFRLQGTSANLVEIENPRLIQGYIESSNVNMIEQMMEMIYLERAYGLGTKVVQARDGSLARAMELGRPTQ